MDHESSLVLESVLDGDLEAYARLREFDHHKISACSDQLGHCLVKPRAVVLVLMTLQKEKRSSALISEWASFIRVGFIPFTRRGPILPINIDYDREWETEISNAIGRLSELGDEIDGCIDDDENRLLIKSLGGVGA